MQVNNIDVINGILTEVSSLFVKTENESVPLTYVSVEEVSTACQSCGTASLEYPISYRRLANFSTRFSSSSGWSKVAVMCKLLFIKSVFSVRFYHVLFFVLNSLTLKTPFR